ncbi:hypothetical protein ACFU8Q_30190 [Streptomyces sp. NPDC057543]|uniref:hypothetical protein n=1 Tax=Streptomyces sp. NPDC057543 TaxID=3346163 RepID=UPI0036C21F42
MALARTEGFGPEHLAPYDYQETADGHRGLPVATADGSLDRGRLRKLPDGGFTARRDLGRRRRSSPCESWSALTPYCRPSARWHLRRR